MKTHWPLTLSSAGITDGEVPTMTNRYQVIERSESGHCCFECTVVDTSRPDMSADGGKAPMIIDGRQIYETVCECFSIENAKLVAEALNRMKH